MKTPCYTTRTGIRIGSWYEPPLRSDFTEEETWVQEVLLGEDPRHLREKAYFSAYCFVLVFVLMLLSTAFNGR